MPSIFSDLEFLWEPGTKPGELLTLQKKLNEAGGRGSMPCHGEIAKSWASAVIGMGLTISILLPDLQWTTHFSRFRTIRRSPAAEKVPSDRQNSWKSLSPKRFWSRSETGTGAEENSPKKISWWISRESHQLCGLRFLTSFDISFCVWRFWKLPCTYQHWPPRMAHDGMILGGNDYPATRYCFGFTRVPGFWPIAMSSNGHQQKTHVAIQLRKQHIVAIVRPGNDHPDSNQSPSEYGSVADSRLQIIGL